MSNLIPHYSVVKAHVSAFASRYFAVIYDSRKGVLSQLSYTVTSGQIELPKQARTAAGYAFIS